MYAIQHDKAPLALTLCAVNRHFVEERVRTSGQVILLPAQEQVEEATVKARRAARHRLTKLAMMIEPDPRRLSEWWDQTPISELGGTPGELVERGLENLVEKFLLAIIFGDRG
jgi:hypothetical protein